MATDREIKFRVWDTVDYMSTPFTLQDLQSHKITFTSDCPVMQYTGLKDKNGKEIYEGDIIEIKHPYKDRMFSGVVSYEEYMWSCKEFFFAHYDIPSEIFSEGTEHIEVIGNIYETPELLK